MELFDTTLRDGEQAAEVHMTPMQKARFAVLLEASGVDVIDAGFPYASDTDWQGVRAVAEATDAVRLSAVATYLKKDIDGVRRALAGHEHRSRLATRLGPEEIYRKNAGRPNIHQRLITRSVSAVRYAAGHFPEVQYYLNYAGTRDGDFLMDLSAVVVDAGATHITVADSQSTFTPSTIAAFVQRLRQRLPDNILVGVHCHNLFGMALANTVAAVEAGARQVETTVGGLGDAGGNVALEQVVAYAHRFGQGDGIWHNRFDLSKVHTLAQALSALTGFQYGSNQPMVGPDTFKVEAGIHQSQLGQIKVGFSPADIGRQTEIVLGRHSGIDGIRAKARELNIVCEGVNWQQVYNTLMEGAASTGTIADSALVSALHDHLENRLN